MRRYRTEQVDRNRSTRRGVKARLDPFVPLTASESAGSNDRFIGLQIIPLLRIITAIT